MSARKSPLLSNRGDGRSPRSSRGGRQDASNVKSSTPSAPQTCEHFNRSAAFYDVRRSSKKIGPKSFVSFSTQKTSPVRIGNRKVEHLNRDISPLHSRHLQLYNYGVQKQMQRKVDPYSDMEDKAAPAVFDESVPTMTGPERIPKDKYSELVAKKKRTNERLEQMRKAK